MVGKRFSDGELRQIGDMLKQDLPVREIAKRLGRSRASVKNKCYRKRKAAVRPSESEVRSYQTSDRHFCPACGREITKPKHIILDPPCYREITHKVL